MLRLFTGIRCRLDTESGLVGYLTYAVGEIVFVAMGILIAIQINNRKHDRVASIEVEGYLFR